MKDRADLSQTQSLYECGSVRTVDEASWQAWQQKNRIRDHNNALLRMKAVKYLCIGGLLATAAFWPRSMDLSLLLQVVVTLSAVFVAWQAADERRYPFVAVFVSIALLYNPLFPAFDSLGAWVRVMVVSSAAPFVISLTWRKLKLAPLVT